MSSNVPQNKCCITSIRNSELLIAKNVFRYFHIERKLQQKLAIKQTEIVTKIDINICTEAANDFLLTKQSEIGVKTIQIPSGISLKMCSDESGKNALPTKTLDQVRPFNVELDSMISSPLKKQEKILSNLTEIKEIVKNYETKNSPSPKSVSTSNLTNATVEPEPEKLNEIHPPLYDSSQMTGKINVAQETSFAEKINKKNEKIEMIKSLLETQKDMKDIQTENLVVKENPVQRLGSLESPNTKDTEEKKIQKLVILEPPIKWKDMRLINSMNYVPKQSILRNYDDNIISQIRYIIHRFYLKYGRAPNIKNICNVIQSLCSIQKDHTDLIYRIISECCGFFQQRSLMNPIFFERRQVTESRLKYLRQIDEYREKNYKIYYLYIKINYSRSKSWVNVVESILSKNKTGCHQLVAMVQVANEVTGLLPQFTKIFQCGRAECIDPTEFDMWLDMVTYSFAQLDKCVLVCGEHVPFYTKFGKHPNVGAWTIQDQEEWFKERGNPPQKESLHIAINKYAKMQERLEKRIKLLFLPLLHFELNPIKYFWQALLKTFSQKINKNYAKFQSLEDGVKFQVFRKIFTIVENNNFYEYVRKVQEVEKFYLRSTPLLMEGDVQRNSLQFDLKSRKQKNSVKRHFENVKDTTEVSEQPANKKNKIDMNKNGTPIFAKNVVQNKIETKLKSNNIKLLMPTSSKISPEKQLTTNTKFPVTGQIKMFSKTNEKTLKIASKVHPVATSNSNLLGFSNAGNIKLPLKPTSPPIKLLTSSTISKNGKKLGPKSFMNKPSTVTSTTTKFELNKSGILFIEKEHIPDPDPSTSLIENDDTQNTIDSDNFEMPFDNIEIKVENTFMDSYDTSLPQIKFVHSGFDSAIQTTNYDRSKERNETVTSSDYEEIQIKEELNYDEYDQVEQSQNYNVNRSII